MIIHISISTGWNKDYVENSVTYPVIETLRRYWKKHPPLHLMVQGFLGIQEKQQMSEEDFMQHLPPTGMP